MDRIGLCFRRNDFSNEKKAQLCLAYTSIEPATIIYKAIYVRECVCVCVLFSHLVVCHAVC